MLVGTLREADRNAEAHTRHEDEAFVLLVLVVGLTASCDVFAEPDPSFAYQYAVRGKGECEGHLPHEARRPRPRNRHAPVDEWRVPGPDEFIRIEADGPAGTRVKCVVRYRPIEGIYGGGGSGSPSQQNSRDEDPTRCALDHVTFP